MTEQFSKEKLEKVNELISHYPDGKLQKHISQLASYYT